MMRSDRVINPIVKAYWAGWESDTLALQHNGWQLSMESDPYRRTIRIAIKHPVHEIYGVSEVLDDWHYPGKILRPLIFQSMAGNSGGFKHVIRRYDAIAPMVNSWQPIDAAPRYEESVISSLDDLIPFRPIASQEVIVAPETVPELMDRILDMQSDKQREIREKARKELRRQGKNSDPNINVHAQIISLAA